MCLWTFIIYWNCICTIKRVKASKDVNGSTLFTTKLLLPSSAEKMWQQQRLKPSQTSKQHIITTQGDHGIEVMRRWWMWTPAHQEHTTRASLIQIALKHHWGWWNYLYWDSESMRRIMDREILDDSLYTENWPNGIPGRHWIKQSKQWQWHTQETICISKYSPVN